MSTAVLNANRYHALSLLLENQCPSEEYSGWNIYRFPLHCEGVVEVYAKKEENGEWVVLTAGMAEGDE